MCLRSPFPQEGHWGSPSTCCLLQLLEIVMDLGRPPIARFPHGDRLLSSKPVTRQDLAHAESKVTHVRPADLNSLKYMHQF